MTLNSQKIFNLFRRRIVANDRNNLNKRYREQEHKLYKQWSEGVKVLRNLTFDSVRRL